MAQRILHAADIHLDSPLSGLAAKAGDRAGELVGATRRAFTALVNFAIETPVDLVLIAGDLYDGDWRDFKTGLFFMAEMARLGRAGIPVGVIGGNHDAENKMTRALTPPPNVHAFSSHKATTWEPEGLGIAVHGRSFPKRDVTENIALDYPDPKPGLLNIGLLHTAADGKPGHAPYAPCTVPELVAKGYDYWALGHVHTREVLCDRPWIVFPGNLQGRHANETGPKGATLITVEDGQIVSVEHQTLDVVRWEQVTADLSGCADFDSALERVRVALTEAVGAAEGRTLAARLTLTGKTAAHRLLAGDLERTTAECLSLAEQAGDDVWLEQIRVRTAEPNQAKTYDADAMADLLRTVEEVRASPEDMDAIRAELTEALGKVPEKVRAAGGLKELDDDVLGSILEGAAAIVRHRLLDQAD